MSERRDDTPEADKPSRNEPARPRGSYYYDDATGYEIYDPDADTEDEEEGETKSTKAEDANLI